MKAALQTIAIILAIGLMPAVATWAVGAFITWDAGWAFADADARLGFLFIVGIILFVFIACATA